MLHRSHISPALILKYFLRFAKQPWIGSKMLKLETEKQLFNLLYPHSRNGMAAKIRQVSIRITDNCNLRCHTCGQWGDNGFLKNQNLKILKKNEVSPSRYRKIFADLVHNSHKPFIYFWGGEPMLYDGILDLITSTTQNHLPTSIATNGTRLKNAAAELVGIPLFLLQLSIDGHCADLHNRLRPSVSGAGDNFNVVRDGLEAIQREKKRQKSSLPMVASVTVISRENVSHLVDIYKTFRDKVDLFVFSMLWWIDEESARRHEVDYQSRFGTCPVKHRGWIGGWKPQDFGLLHHQMEKLKRWSRSFSGPPVTFIPPMIAGEKCLEQYYTDHSERFGFDQCVSIFQSVEINSNGDISPCRDYHDYVVGNVKEKTITELWNSDAFRRFRTSIATDGLMPVCSRCCGLMGY